MGLTARRAVHRRRVVVVTAATVLLVLASPAVASAHTRAQASTDFDSRITHAPDIPGVGWRVYAGGEYLELTNTSDAVVTVPGYDGEPYLRVGPAGVERNRRSPATYLNAERYGDVAVPPRADPAAAPEWERLSEARTYAWHDHRIHWMSESVPPVVAADRGTAHQISTWTVPFEHGNEPFAVEGTLGWEPGPPAWPWLVLGLIATAPALLGLARRRDVRSVVRPAAVVVAVVAAVNAIHYVDEVVAWPVPVVDVLFGMLHTTLFVGAGVVGAAVAWRGRSGPFLSLGIASGAVLFHQGLLQLTVLGASQLPTVWPAPVLRLAVALSVAQAVWVAVVIITGMRARRSSRDDEPPAHETDDRGEASIDLAPTRPRSTV